MSSDIPADEVTETVEDPGNADPDMALRSAQDVDDPTGRRAHAQQNPDGPPGRAASTTTTSRRARTRTPESGSPVGVRRRPVPSRKAGCIPTEGCNMYNEMDIDRIRGAVAYDQSGDRIGNVGEVYLDDQTGQPMWVTVNTGFFGLRTSFVPLEGSRFEDDDRLVLAHDKDRIKDAPNVDEDGHLDRAQEDELYSYYGVGSAAALGADQLRTRRWEDESVLGDRGVADDRSVFDRDGDGRGPVGEVLDGPGRPGQPASQLTQPQRRGAPVRGRPPSCAQGTRCVQASVRNLVSISSRAASSSASV